MSAVQTPNKGIKKMSLRLMSAFAALLLLAACESSPSTTGNAGSEGASSSSSSSSQVVPGTQQDLVANVGDRVFFDLNRWNVRADQRAVLDRQSEWLKRFPQVTVTIEGHADERGTREYNLALGAKRAAAVKNYLVAAGINPNRVDTISYGKERPEVVGSNEEAWRQNRRSVTVVKQPRVGS
jgi:peptidoglycan-associated lipoprotein